MAADPAAHAVISSGVAPGVAEPAGRPAPEGAEGLLIEERRFALEQVADNGSKFHLANGYMGYRGTLEEFGRTEQVACTLAGLYDQAGEAWREPVNAPNVLYTLIDCDG